VISQSDSFEQLVYLSNARMPTEKAHGFQIAKMCEAFSGLGLNVSLVHPYRIQPEELRGADPLKYYSIPQGTFELQTIPNPDLLWIFGKISKRIEPVGSRLQNMLHAWSVQRFIEGLPQMTQRIFFSRDVLSIARLAARKKRTPGKLVFEAHKPLPRSVMHYFPTLKELDLIAVLTEPLQHYFVQRGIPKEKTLVLPDAVDLKMAASRQDPAECRRQLGLPLDSQLIGYVGRFHTMGMEKGLPELIRSVGGLKRRLGRDFNAKLVCVGGPLDRVFSYRKLGADVGLANEEMLFFDRVSNSEVPLWIRSFDIVAAPFPDTEHYRLYMSPLKIFEYMASGVPMVATDLPSLREVLTDGENVLMAQPGDETSMSNCLEQLLTQPQLRTKVARAALNTVKEYTWEKRAARVLARLSETSAARASEKAANA